MVNLKNDVMRSAGEYAYTPESGEALGRIVGLIREYYPNRSLTECRELLALMYGHASWLALATAAARGEPSLPDEEAPAARVIARRAHQYRVLLTHFGGITAAAEASAAQIDRELAAASPSSITLRHDPRWRRQRIERARCAFGVAYARHALEDIRPSARARRATPVDDESVHLSLRIELLPHALGHWIEQQRPRLAPVAAALAGRRVRQHAPCDLLDFAFLWGEACVRHPNEIPEPLQVYPLALCAKWYAWNGVAQFVTGYLQEAAGGSPRPRLAAPGGLDPTAELQRELLRAQPREDLAEATPAARDRHIEAGYVHLRAALAEAAAARPVHHFIARTGAAPALLRSA